MLKSSFFKGLVNLDQDDVFVPPNSLGVRKQEGLTFHCRRLLHCKYKMLHISLLTILVETNRL